MSTVGRDIGALVLVGVLRLIWPISYIGLHPFSVHMLNIYFDWLDGGVAGNLGLSRNNYEYVDKSLDLYYYLASGAYLLTVRKNLWYANAALVFLAWRIIGNIIFLATLQPPVLIVCPNVFQLFFTLYTFLDVIRVDAYIRDTPMLHGGLMAMLVILKIGTEGGFHDEVLPDLADDEHICKCNTAWLWLEQFLFITLILLVFALFIGMTRVANYIPPRKPPFTLPPMGEDLEDGSKRPKSWESKYHLPRHKRKAAPLE